ncbi:hypothetical protein JTB14_028792 [Gonioctena quinquepunctata]|nr:hypothetical protein JTB14_028792 [Gonioctena quinquepunctata]
MENDKDLYEKIGELCLERFESLSGKPNPNEWTVLSCIVLEAKGQLKVVALGTGSKCIGRAKMSASGDILNDSHAEVMCRRSFLRYIYHQMRSELSILIFNEDSKKFALDPDVKFHFFTTQVPCGDAAIFPKQTIESFGEVIDDLSEVVPCKKMKTAADIFRTGAKCLEGGEIGDLKLPGSGYHVLGAVRTKPGRGDPTLSVSCSDKLSRWCHVGVQGALLALLLDKPIYLNSLVVAAGTPFSEESLQRALYGRVGEVGLKEPYFRKRMVIVQCLKEFEYAKTDGKRAASGSVSWCDVEGKRSEVAVNGKRQGVTKKKANSEAARLKICKLELFKAFSDVCEYKNIQLVKDCDNRSLAYVRIKMLAGQYQEAWKLLRKSFKMWTRKDENLIKFSIK